MVDDKKKEKEECDWEIISTYDDEQAIEDGVLLPLRAGGKDTGHRITRNAYETLRREYENEGWDGSYLRQFVLNETLPLTPYAKHRWNTGGLFKTDYRFRSKRDSEGAVLWYVPNELGGITVMLPEDY